MSTLARHLRRPLLILLALVLAACSGSEPDPSTAEPTSTEELLAAAATALAGTSGLAFTVEQTGAVVHIDDDGLLGFVAATGRFAAPRSADAIVTVDLRGLTTEIGAVAIDGSVWLTNPVSGAWEPAPSDLGFDPAAVFSADIGLPVVLRDGVSDATEMDGAGSAGGATLRHVRGTVDADHISTITGGLIGTATEVDFFIDAASDELRIVEFVVPVDGIDSSWTIGLDDYGTTPDIVDPTTD